MHVSNYKQSSNPEAEAEATEAEATAATIPLEEQSFDIETKMDNKKVEGSQFTGKIGMNLMFTSSLS